GANAARTRRFSHAPRGLQEFATFGTYLALAPSSRYSMPRRSAVRNGVSAPGASTASVPGCAAGRKGIAAGRHFPWHVPGPSADGTVEGAAMPGPTVGPAPAPVRKVVPRPRAERATDALRGGAARSRPRLPQLPQQLPREGEVNRIEIGNLATVSGLSK